MNKAREMSGAASRSRRHWWPNWVLGICWWVFFVFFLRVFWLQGLQQDEWRKESESNRAQTLTLRAPRGRILDRFGKVLADNEVLFTRVITNEKGQSVEIPVSDEERVHLTATNPATIRVNYVRSYPFGPVLSHLLGYVQNPQGSHDVVIGLSGIERNKNQDIAGHDGVVVFERTARGRAQRKLFESAPKSGNDVTTTIDSELSQEAFRLLSPYRGAILISKPQTGDVLTMVTSPSFVPANEANPESPWKDIPSVSLSISDALKAPNTPFLFRPTNASYPPGSVFKIVTALAGLERSAFTSDTIVRDEGELKVGDFTYQNWYWRQYGRSEGDISLERALSRSNDIFFYKAAEWIGPDALAEFARYMSFGSPTGIGVVGEQSGLIPDPSWKQQHFGEKWFLGNTYHMGIGQGDVLVTPIQVQVMMSTVAARGRRCRPRALESDPISCQEISLQPSSLATVWAGLRGACSPGGTAYPLFTTPYDVMCKTGTAELGAENEKGQRPTHGWLTAAVSTEPRPKEENAPFEPEIVITVVIESDEEKPFREGSADAAPIVKELSDWYLRHRVNQAE